MNEGAQEPPRYRLTFGLGIETDLSALDPEALDAAEAILDDLAHGRVVGKQLGARKVSGDLTGLARVKFEAPGRRPQRFRLIYRQVDEATRDVVALGQRDEHAIYRAAVRRLDPDSTSGPG